MDNINLDTFEKRYNHNVTPMIEQKKVEGKSKKTGKEYSYTLDYISWAYAQKLAMSHDPDFDWFPVETEKGSLNHDGMVLIKMTFLGKTKRHYFPILDGANKAIANPNAFDINTAQMRGMTKLFSMMSGFGLSLYTGEDIKNLDQTGEEDTKINNSQNTNPKKEDDKGFDRTKTIEWLNEKYNSNDDEFKAYLKAKLKYFKRSAPTYLKGEELQEIIQELKEKKEVNKLKKMIDFINSNKEKHADLIDNALREKESPFVDTLEKQEIEELYRLIKGVEAS